MEARIALGGTLDIVSKGELDESLSELEQSLRPLPRPVPMYVVRSQAGLMPAAGALVLDLGRPPAGHIWNVTGMTTYSTDDATTLANGKVALYATGSVADPGLSDLLVPAFVVPSYDDFSEKVLWCYSSENLVIRATGAAASSQVGVNVYVTEWRAKDVLTGTGR